MDKNRNVSRGALKRRDHGNSSHVAFRRIIGKNWKSSDRVQTEQKVYSERNKKPLFLCPTQWNANACSNYNASSKIDDHVHERHFIYIVGRNSNEKKKSKDLERFLCDEILPVQPLCSIGAGGILLTRRRERVTNCENRVTAGRKLNKCSAIPWPTAMWIRMPATQLARPAFLLTFRTVRFLQSLIPERCTVPFLPRILIRYKLFCDFGKSLRFKKGEDPDWLKQVFLLLLAILVQLIFNFDQTWTLVFICLHWHITTYTKMK